MILMPTSGMDVMDGSKGGGFLEHQTMMSSGGTLFGQQQTYGGSMYQNNMQGFMTNTLSSGQYNTGMHSNSYKKQPNFSSLEGFKENRMQLKTVSGAGDFETFTKRSNTLR